MKFVKSGEAYLLEDLQSNMSVKTTSSVHQDVTSSIFQ